MTSPGEVRFDGFALRSETGELLKHGRRVRVQEQAVLVLAALAARPGDLLTREELQRLLWPEGSPVDVEHGLNVAVNRLREALGDAASAARFIETVPRKGYRFIGEFEKSETTESVGPTAQRQERRRSRWLMLAAVVGMITIVFLTVMPFPDPQPITSLVVLPLEDMSRDPDEEYFALGMTEALISELSTIPDLRIISRTSAMRYRLRDEPLAEIARALGVEAVLEGSVARAGGRLRVTVRLVAFDPERQLWTGSFERNEREVFFLQQDLARTVAREFHIALAPEVEDRLADARPVHPEAHESVLKGWHLTRKISRENYEAALSYFERATELDPKYAEPYVGITASLAGLTIAGWRYPDETYLQQKEALATALSLDGTLGVAHAWLAQFKRNAEWDWTGAERTYLRAIALSPGSTYPRTLYGGYLMGHARYAEALEQFEWARRVDPLAPSPTCMAGWTLSFMKEFDRAKERIAQSIELDPDLPCAYRALSSYYWAQERREDAAVALERAAEVSERAPTVLGRLGSYYARSGQHGKAREILNEVMDVPEGRRVSAFAAARIHSSLGEKEEALDWLERAYQSNEYGLAFLPTGNQFAWLRSEPRFQEILAGMKFGHDRSTDELIVEQ